MTEYEKCVKRFIKSVDDMEIRVGVLDRIRDKYIEEYNIKGDKMKIYCDAEEFEATIFGHYELDIDREDLKEYSEEEIKKWILDEGEFIIDDMDFIKPTKLFEIEV